MLNPGLPLDDRLATWSRHLASIAESAGETPEPRTHPFFLAWRAHREGRDADPYMDEISRAADDRLWEALLVEQGHTPTTREEHSKVLDLTGEGPIRPQSDASAIEVWTESELSAIHALAWYAHTLGRSALLSRTFDACRWHIDNTQPDNATNHAWAVHLFAVLAERDISGEARLYAETLLHNCQVTSGVPDPLSARILHDASQALVEIDWSAG